MKLVILILTTAILQVSAAANAQKITLNEKNASLATVFKEIRKQSNYDFLYDQAVLTDTKLVTIRLKDATIEEALNACFTDQPLTYTIQNKIVVVKEKVPVAEPKTEVLPPTHDINGVVHVKAPRGADLAGASIIIKRTQTGTLSDRHGGFVLKNVYPTDTLLISYIGYKTLKIAVGEETTLDISMEETTNSLDQVVIQAYGTTTQRTTTGDIGTVTAAEIERQPVMNPLLALQGKIAGVEVTQTSGYASAPLKIEIRGRGSIDPNITSDPLYIIDGVPLTVLEIGGTSGYGRSSGFLQSGLTGPANGQSPFFNLNPSDIESITVLKDADATSIYGSRGANGVIIITTKKGKAGDSQFDVNVQQGIQEQTRFYQLMNTQQYLQMREEALRNTGIIPSIQDGDYDIVQYNTNSYTDWQKALYGNIGQNTNVQMNLSGGSDETTYRLSGGYANATDILTVSGGDKKANVSFNVEHHSRDKRFTVGLSSSYAYTLSNMIDLPNAILLPPDAPPIYDANGNLNYAGYGANNSRSRNNYPFAGLLAPYSAETNFLNSALSLTYQPIKNLNITTTAGYNFAVAGTQQYTTIASQDPLQNPTGTSQLGNNTNKNWIIEPQITYDALIGKGTLNVLVGGSVQQTNTDGIATEGYGFTSDNLIKNIGSAASTGTSENYGEYKYAAIFGRVSYNWDGKYLLNLNARRDGSSRFGPGNQFGDFGSVGAGWIFTEESWAKDALSFLSFGKFRGSYGTSGSDAVGDYQYLTRFTSLGISYGGDPTLAPTQHADPNYKWEVNKKLEGAIELGFLKDRVTLFVDYYRNRVGNQLIQFPTPAFSGFPSVYANSPALVQNSGWELTAGAKVIDAKDFKWSVSFNTSKNDNKLLAYPDLAQSPYNGIYVIGQSLNIVRKLQYTGIDPLNGLPTFKDKNGDGAIVLDTSNPSLDDSYIYNTSPQFFGGMGMNFSYKSFQLSMSFAFVKQIGQNAYLNTSQPIGRLGNQPAAIIGTEWQNPGDIAQTAKFTTISPDGNGNGLSPFSAYKQSDAAYTDASYIRLSNVSLSYSLPESIAKKFGMKSGSIFVHTNNIFTITDYKGIDPETQSFGSLPPSRVIDGGVSFNF